MVTTTVLGWFALVVLIGANALFVATEFALTSVDRAAVARRAAGGDRRAGLLGKALRTLSFQLSSVQLGITVCSLLLGFVAEPVIASALEPVLRGVGISHKAVEPTAVVVALVLATVAQMLLGELIPQNLALAAPLGVGRLVIGPHRIFTAVARPVVRVFDRAANGVVRLLGVEPQEELRGARSVVEFRAMIAASAEEGTLAGSTARLMHRGLLFGDQTAGGVMTPRTQVVAVRTDDTVSSLLELVHRTGHSRLPVTRGDLDNVVGIVHVGAALGVPRSKRAVVRVGGLMAEPILVPESLDCDALLRRVSDTGAQLVVVVDEYGGTAGVVTLEDLVEELVGQVRDEFDAGETPEVRRTADGWELSGRVHVTQLAELLDVAVPRGPFDTVGGLMMARLGRLPAAGDEVDVAGWLVTVTAVDGRRVDRVVAMSRDAGGPA